MLTILHDQLVVDGNRVETASAEGYEVIAPRKATCRLAAVLIEQGHRSDEPVRLVRADPYLSSPPHTIKGITLAVAAKVDFFGDGEDAASRSGAAPLDPVQPPHKS